MGAKQGRPRIISPQDAFIITLMRLRRGFLEEHLSDMFKTSIATIHRIVITWINHMYIVLGRLPIWAPRHVIDAYMPESIMAKYPSTRYIEE